MEEFIINNPRALGVVGAVVVLVIGTWLHMYVWPRGDGIPGVSPETIEKTRNKNV